VLGLVALVEAFAQRDGRPFGAIGLQVFRVAHRVLRDDGVGRAQDGGRRAVVLLEGNQARAGKVVGELVDVPNAGAAPLVDRLVGIAHGAHVAVRRGEQLHQLVLRRVRVLELVNEQVPAPAAPAGVGLGVVAQHADGLHEQVVEVHRARAPQAGLVLGVDGRHAAAEAVAAAGRVRVGLEHGGLGVLDLGLDGRGRQLLRVDAEVAHDLPDEALAVGLVVDREVVRETDPARLAPQQAGAERVERAQQRPTPPSRAGGAKTEPRQHPLDTLAHLVGGLVCERDAKD